MAGLFFCKLQKNYAAPILYIPVPQVGHFAFIAGLPFFIVTFSGLATSFFALHFTQYIDAIVSIHLLSIIKIQNYFPSLKLLYILAKYKENSRASINAIINNVLRKSEIKNFLILMSFSFVVSDCWFDNSGCVLFSTVRARGNSPSSLSVFLRDCINFSFFLYWEINFSCLVLLSIDYNIQY